MNTICRRIAEHGNLDHVRAVFRRPMRWPDGRIWFFPHAAFLQEFLRTDPDAAKARKLALFTHWRYGTEREREVIDDLRTAEAVFCASTSWRDWLVERGVDPRRVAVVYAGCDAGVFTAGRSTRPVVGFSGGYQDRKDPHRMFALVTAMPDVDFVLLGRNWERAPGFPEVAWRPNFRYTMAPYDRYPDVYHQMRVFVSTTLLDGGPMGLLEAMMCDVMPVASRAGYAPDLIRDGHNGYLFDLDASVEELIALVRRALADDHPGRVRRSVEHLSWERYADIVILRGSDGGSPVELRRVRADDRDLLLRWSNDPTVRAGSFQPAVIPEQEHERWFAERLDDIGTRMWLLSHDGHPAGQVRYQRSSARRADVHISVDRAHRGHGHATDLLRHTARDAAAELAVGCLVALVIEGNEGSRRAFERAGYEFRGIATVEDRLVRRYELAL